MKRLIIICEGFTEQAFVKDVLQPHFNSKGIQIQYPFIKKSGGGIVHWEVLQKQIQNHLKGGNDKPFVTMLINFYGIRKKHNYPNWLESENMDKLKRMDTLEKVMLSSIDSSINQRFIPYIQLHEFEGLLFNNIDSFEDTFESKEFKNKNELISILEKYDNPEMINDNPHTIPSKRLKNLIRGYDKVVYGSILAKTIGIYNIRKKSPRFNNWIQKLEDI